MKYSVSDDDKKLIKGCLSGFEEAWEALISKHQRLIYTICKRYHLDDDEAGDIFGRVSMVLLQHLKSIKDHSRLPAWLITTTSRECWQYHKNSRTVSLTPNESNYEIAYVLEPATEFALPEEELLSLEQRHQVRDAFKQLPKRNQKLLWYLFFDDKNLSYNQIAAELNMPVSSIGPTRGRSLEKLRQLME
jgi:RNA polymerase sigma factor (sigma-70 family)